MISDARGSHVSPGVYTDEREVTYSVQSLGITSLGLAGETVKGPAFQPVDIQNWTEFVDYFGGTSPEKYKGNGLPKYELPYIAQSYLQQSKRLSVVRVLGLSGYDAGSAYTITASSKTGTYPIVVLRSKADYSGTADGAGLCGNAQNEKFSEIVKDVELLQYTGTEFGSMCEVTGSAYTVSLKGVVKVTADGTHTLVDSSNSGYTSGKFGIKVTYYSTDDRSETGNTATITYNVSLDPYDRDYIYNVFSIDPLVGSAPLYIEAVYDRAYEEMINALSDGDQVTFALKPTTSASSFRETYRCAQTPWIVSEVKNASAEAINLKRLFKVFTISDGNASNFQVKVSIENIRPDEGLFNLVVRDFYDTDDAPVILERFNNLSMAEGNSNFIGLKIGTYDGTYLTKSKYITVMLSDEEGVDACVPCGFLGYPMPTYESDRISMAYNRVYDTDVKAKKQSFGLTAEYLDEDLLTYKGKDAYSNGTNDFDSAKLTNGFHLDAILAKGELGTDSAISGATIYVDDKTGFTFTTVQPVQNDTTAERLPRIVTETYMEKTIYADKNLRKFTVYPYGGFDGWDIYREQRTNTDKFKGTKYALVSGCPFDNIGEEEVDLDPSITLNLPSNAITSDYYAYLAGYKQFINPNETDINLFATPGIDFYNNSLLTLDALDVIEDGEDGRGGDALYIMTAPYDSEHDTADTVVSALEDSEVNSSYACTYWPWVKYFDSNAQVYIDLPVTKDVVRNMAYIDNVKYPWFAPAGVERGNVECAKTSTKLRLVDEDTLYDGMINPIKSFASDGVKVWGNKTAYFTGDNVVSPLDRINVRRLMIRVKKLIMDAAKSLVFEQYDSTLDKQFRSLVEPILNDVKSNRGISDYKLKTENTAETRDQHILPAVIMVKPTPALEWVSISFVVYPESVEFED